MVISITQSYQIELAYWLGIIGTTRRRPKKNSRASASKLQAPKGVLGGRLCAACWRQKHSAKKIMNQGDDDRWCGRLRLGQSYVIVLDQLGDVEMWVRMKVTGYSRGRNGDASTISELNDEAGTVHTDRITLPHETVREYTCKADVERANAELASIEDSDGDSDNEQAQGLAPNEGAVASDEEVTRALDMGEDERAAGGTAGAEDEPPAGAATGGATTANMSQNTVDSPRIDVSRRWMDARA
jgi:hypothetical protein